MIRILLIAFIILGIFISAASAQVPDIGLSHCVVGQDSFLNIMPCGWGDSAWVVGFGIFILILVFFFFPKSTPPQPGQVVRPQFVAKKAVQKPKKPKIPTGKLPLTLGILAVISSPAIPFGGVILGVPAIMKSLKMKKPNKKSLAGLILGWLAIGITIIAYVGALFPRGILFLIVLLALFWLFFLLKKSKKEKNYWGIASFISGLLSILTYFYPLSGIALGVAAIIFSNKQKKIKKTKMAKWGFVLGIIGIMASVFFSLGGLR